MMEALHKIFAAIQLALTLTKLIEKGAVDYP
jgi:hypothetical protein